MVKWSPVRCSYFQKSCNMPFHSISVCVSTEHPRSNTISGSIFMLYDIFHLDGFLYLFSNIKSDLKPLRNIVLVLVFQKNFFFFFAKCRQREKSLMLKGICFLIFRGLRSFESHESMLLTLLRPKVLCPFSHMLLVSKPILPQPLWVARKPVPTLTNFVLISSFFLRLSIFPSFKFSHEFEFIRVLCSAVKGFSSRLSVCTPVDLPLQIPLAVFACWCWSLLAQMPSCRCRGTVCSLCLFHRIPLT